MDDAARFILSELLSEFRERDLKASDLSGYMGLPPKELRDRSVAKGISEVDFDLAMSDLDHHGLVKTGPMQLYDNPPGSSVTVIAFFSKREYSYLTENGYKEAVRSASQTGGPDGFKGSPKREGTVFHGSQYINYGQAGAIGPHSTGTINYQNQWRAIQNQVDLSALATELEQLKKHLQQSARCSSDYQQLALLSEAEEHAKKHDGGKAMELLSKVGKGALGIAKDIGTEIAAKVIAKSMGLEP